MTDVAELIRRHAVLPDRRPTYDWAGGTPPDHTDAAVNFGNTTAFKGRYDVTNVPWTRAFLDACDNPLVREVTFVAPPQDSGKTKAAETYLARRIATKPTNIAFYTTTNVKAEQWGDTRWNPMLNAVRGIKDRYNETAKEKKKKRILFKDGTFLLILGAETEGNRASDSVEVVINDEVYLWQRPWLKEVYDRTNAYRDTRKCINVSVGGSQASELHERFQAGNQLEWCHPCPACQRPFAYVFDHRRPECNIRFDLNAVVVHADGRLDLREFAKTIYVECPNKECRQQMRYDRDRLRRQNLAGVYIAQNPGADPTIVSLHVNAFAIGREPWVEILEPWVRLNVRGGVFAPAVLKEFITKKLAEFWNEKPFVVTTELKLAAWSRADLIRPKSWSEELFRVMTCDNQRGRKGDIPHRIYAAGAFSRGGRLRVFDAGRINEWSDLKNKQVELGVPDPTEQAPGPWVMIDRRYEPVEVDEWCARFKWYGSMGATQDEFVHPPYSPFAGTRQLFSEPRSIDVGFGTAEMGRSYATYFLWSSQRIQDLLAQLRNAGMIEFARDIGEGVPDIATQMNSHRQFMDVDRFMNERRVWKRIGDTPDHVYDIVSQMVAIGCMAGLFGNTNQ
jgi:hypothetical protein